MKKRPTKEDLQDPRFIKWNAARKARVAVEREGNSTTDAWFALADKAAEEIMASDSESRPSFLTIILRLCAFQGLIMVGLSVLSTYWPGFFEKRPEMPPMPPMLPKREPDMLIRHEIVRRRVYR